MAGLGKTVYVNDTEAAITPIVGKTVAPGATYKPADGKYIASKKGLRIIRHRPSPLVKLFAGEAISWQNLTDLEQYAQLELKNKTGTAATITINGDTDNQYVLFDGEVKVLDLDRDISTLAATWTGGGNFYVYGTRA